MKVLIDTNILISAALNLNSTPGIRDVMDRPILRAALNANADVLLTGDKDFLESGLSHPRIMTATEFLQE